jgi:hypothetical protein
VLEGSSGGGGNELGKSLSAMMAARDQQDSMWSSGAQGQGQGQGAKAQGQASQIVISQKTAPNRKIDMDIILQGDIGDD